MKLGQGPSYSSWLLAEPGGGVATGAPRGGAAGGGGRGGADEGGAQELRRGLGTEGGLGWAVLEPGSRGRIGCELADAVPHRASPLELGRSGGKGGGLSVLGWLAGAEHGQGALAGSGSSRVCSLCVRGASDGALGSRGLCGTRQELVGHLPLGAGRGWWLLGLRAGGGPGGAGGWLRAAWSLSSGALRPSRLHGRLGRGSAGGAVR